MKRVGNLMPDIADLSNLYNAYYKAVKSKRHKADALEYTKNLDLNLSLLSNQFLTGNIETGNYHYFKIFDPKERLICAAGFSERVMHHAIMNICHPLFEKHLIYHSYATRKGKGTYASLDIAKQAVKKYKWVAKLDIRKYFDSIPHLILQEKLQRLFKDKLMLSIFSKIINSYHASDNKGIPIGNLTSQYFANYYLSSADHYAKEQLQIPVYIRYMDDILLFEQDKETLKRKVKSFCEFVETGLHLTFKLIDINATSKGVSFLGYRLFSDVIKLNQSSKKRFIRKFKGYSDYVKNGIWTQEEYSRHILPLIAFTNYASAKGLRNKCIEIITDSS